MPEQPALNYPDILGIITGGERFDAAAVQMALAVRPRVVRAGRPFEAVLLLQNCTGATIDIRGRLLLPEEDTQKKPGRFTASAEPLCVTLRAAETGYAVLPITVHADTAPGSAYKVAVAVEFQAAPDAPPVRRTTGSDQRFLPADTNLRLMELKSLAFSAAQRGLFGSVIEAPFSVLPPQSIPLLQPEWVSLWSPGAYASYRPLLEHHRDTLLRRVLPQLQNEAVYTALYNTTDKTFAAAGYPIQPAETAFIARLLVSVLWMAAFPHTAVEYPGQELYHVRRTLEQGAAHEGSFVPLPNWCRALLERLTLRPTADPIAALAGPLYDELLSDAITHGFRLLYAVTGQQLGSDDDMREYSAQLIILLRQPGARLSLVDVYLPLVLGGIAAEARAGTIQGGLLDIVSATVQRHRTANSQDDPLVLDMIESVLRWARDRCDDLA
ncbi:MAG: hypothetical protein HZC41_04555 [Chloroflexi bacterium]|nr:hypothetical protein [Chloroflexota bacterium]